MRRPFVPFLALSLGAETPADPDTPPSPHSTPGMIQNILGRPLDAHGLTPADWEGPIANPAIRFDLMHPPDAVNPVRFVIRAKEPRLSFDLPSEHGPVGPRNEVLIPRPGRFTMAVWIFPDREARDEDHQIEIDVAFADGPRSGRSCSPCL